MRSIPITFTRRKKMSYDSDFENVYMVEFESGRTIHVGQFTVQDVIEYCNDEHEGEVIKSIYQEVYIAEKV
jgi:hypothetical protein